MAVCGRLCLLWLAVLVVCSSSSSSSNSSKRFTTHPMLYYSADQVPNMIQKARTTHSRISDILVEAARSMIAKPQTYLPPTEYNKFGGLWNEIYGNNLAALAMYCVLYPEDQDARELAFTFMDNLDKLPKWQVIALPLDEVPVAHTLTGFTTAFDFLYPVMNADQRSKYLQRIIKVTKEFYDLSKTRAWGRQYLQNHVATNYLALLHGSLVVSLHLKEAEEWINHARRAFDKTLLLLDQIVDGSLDEGVAYGTYTSRSVTQYIHLMKRHLDVDHTQGLWLREHFWFYYNTILPRFQRSIGIADSNNNWFYGPESQLVFLDSFVLRNGWGKWLAEEIRKARPADKTNKLAPSMSQRWCTIHTEFLWYDPSLQPRAPPQSGKPDLHVFSDWGVATYSKVAPTYHSDTFLAFKSGKMHGRGIFDIVQRNMYASWINKWSNFNPGHEHPDQNMFVFAPNGQLFIGDGLYGPKNTSLNNVLLFAPSPTSRCGHPWEGQLGECEKWLKWRAKEVEKYGGDLVTASLSHGMVHISGEAREAYHPSMRLLSVYRSLVLLNPNLLVVLDHIETQPTSPLTHTAAFFHNTDVPFKADKLLEMNGAKATIKSKEYKMLWISPEGHSPKATILRQAQQAEYKTRDTNFVNVTLKLRPRLTRIAYALMGPSEKVLNMGFLESKLNGVSFMIKTEEVEYRILTATKHDDPVARREFLGYPGYVLVRRGGHPIKFGVNSTLGFHPVSEKEKHFGIFNLSGAVIPAFILVFVIGVYATSRRTHNKIYQRKKLVLGIVSIIGLGLLSLNSIILRQTPTPTGESQRSSGMVGMTAASNFPSVVITSLPGSGSDILGWLFYYNPDFRFLRIPSEFAKLKEEPAINPFVDACVWARDPEVQSPTLVSAIKALQWVPQKDISSRAKRDSQDVSAAANNNTIPSDPGDDDNPSRINMRKVLAHRHYGDSKDDINYKVYSDKQLLEHIKKFPNSQSVLHFQSGSWGLKVNWLDEVLGNTVYNVYVARDPRAWVANFLRDDLKLYASMDVARHLSELATASCKFKTLETFSFSSPHKMLAQLWEAYTTDVLASLVKKHGVVRFEDLVRSPGILANDIYQSIGFPLPPAMEQQFIQAAQSRVYLSPHEGVVHPSMLDRWKTELTTSQIADIETICASGMKRLNYIQMDAD